MDDSGATKDDVKIPEGEVGEKINKLFVDESKDTSKFGSFSSLEYLTNNLLDVIVLTAMGEELAIDAKEAPKG